MEIKKCSPQLITSLANAITGGSGGSVPRKVSWPYRTAGEIARFFRQSGYDMGDVVISRVSWTEGSLSQINNEDGINGMRKIIEHLLDPLDWLDDKELLLQLVNRLNECLKRDGYEINLDAINNKYIVENKDKSSPIINEATKFIDIETVKRDFKRALDSVDKDPEAALTSASSVIESTCKGILDKLVKPYPDNQDISHLFGAVIKELKLSASQYDDQDTKRILGGVENVVKGVGALRTKLGTAHGRGESHIPVDSSLARLTIGTASSVIIFLLESFDKYNKQ